MGRPRKYVRPQIRRKCHTCGKMVNQPYIHTTMPEAEKFDTYTKSGVKTLRSEIKGAKITYHCSKESYDIYKNGSGKLTDCYST